MGSSSPGRWPATSRTSISHTHQLILKFCTENSFSTLSQRCSPHSVPETCSFSPCGNGLRLPGFRPVRGEVGGPSPDTEPLSQCRLSRGPCLHRGHPRQPPTAPGDPLVSSLFLAAGHRCEGCLPACLPRPDLRANQAFRKSPTERTKKSLFLEQPLCRLAARVGEGGGPHGPGQGHKGGPVPRTVGPCLWGCLLAAQLGSDTGWVAQPPQAPGSAHPETLCIPTAPGLAARSCACR